MLDLATSAVFLDFDGTCTRADVGVHLLERLADPSWHEVEVEYKRGEIGSRECMSRQWELVDPAIARDEAAVRAVAREVDLDPDLERLVEGLRHKGADVTVVSDGYGFYVHDVCAPLGVAVLTNAIDFATGELSFPNEDRCCPCSSCGTCKQAPIKEARRRGRTTVLIGDGASDRKAALLADVVFAKTDLADWCDDAGIDYVPFTYLADVGHRLLGWPPR